jgi:hypothetical protein
MTASMDPTGMVNNIPKIAIFQWGRTQLPTSLTHRLFIGENGQQKHWGGNRNSGFGTDEERFFLNTTVSLSMLIA